MARLAGERVSTLKGNQWDLTIASLGALAQANAGFPCHTQPNRTLDQSFAARERDHE